MSSPVDDSNKLLAECPALLDCSLIGMGAARRLGLTIRTPSTTLTVMLTKADAASWASLITESAAQLSGSGLLVGKDREPVR